jgi:hypothetical protein
MILWARDNRAREQFITVRNLMASRPRSRVIWEMPAALEETPTPLA